MTGEGCNKAVIGEPGVLNSANRSINSAIVGAALLAQKFSAIAVIGRCLLCYLANVLYSAIRLDNSSYCTNVIAVYSA